MSIGYCHYCDASMGHRPTCPRVTGETVPALKRRIAELEAQLSECQKDAERLNWLSEAGAQVIHNKQGFCLFWHTSGHCTYLYNTSREAIDAAIKESK